MRVAIPMIGVLLMALWGCESDGSDKVSSGGNSSAVVNVRVAFPGLEFTQPLDLAYPDDGTNRLFVVEQPGRIRLFANDSNTSSMSTFLDIRDRVNDAGWEQGLLGLAFHPDYATNGYFYLNYTASNPNRTVISRFNVSSDDPDAADETSEQVILEFSQPYSNHNGGCLKFGPDGYLYIGTGDGGSADDPHGNGQNRSTLLGKILRIDVDASAGGRNYGIPLDNPFAGNSEGYRQEIYAYGIRNAWRFSFDTVAGRLWVGEVGQDAVEEIDIIENGGNYGWNIMEGTDCFNPPTGCDTAGLILPIAEYRHPVGLSVTGGAVYRGTTVPELAGKYVYADFMTGLIWALTYDGSTAEVTTLLDSDLSIASFGVDQNNELYFLAFDGYIYRFESPSGGP